MSTISHPPAAIAPETHWFSRLLVRELWASLAIAAMWTAVVVATVWGPDLVTSSGSGADSVTIPSGIAIAMFATIATWFVAKYGFTRQAADE
jgi:hypothetical protein